MQAVTTVLIEYPILYRYLLLNALNKGHYLPRGYPQCLYLLFYSLRYLLLFNVLTNVINRQQFSLAVYLPRTPFPTFYPLINKLLVQCI
jgi:hypothetical protein